MLQIYLYGPTEQGYLDINPDTELELESLSDAFDEDLSIGEFSLPIDLPWTDNNRRLFGFAERLKNYRTETNYYRCDVSYKHWPELIGAKITILEKAGTFSYSRGSFSTTISGTKGLFGSLIKNKTLKDLKLGGPITWTGKNSREFAEAVMKGFYPQYNHISFAPVAIENFIQKDRPDYTTEFLAKDTVNTVIISGGGWTFGRPQSGNPAAAAPAGTAEHMDYRTVPFFNLKYVLRKVFEEHGFKVTGDFINDPEFNELFLFNNFAVEDYAATIYRDFNTTITPANHMPKMPVADFLKGVFGFFSLFPVFKGAGEVQLRYHKRHLKDRKVLSLNGLCSHQFNSVFQEASTEKGYKINYVWDSADGMYSDRVKDLKEKTLCATVATFANLANLNIGRPLTTDDIAFVAAENIYYVVADATTNPLKWDAWAERLNEYTKDEGERSIDVPISTLCSYVEFNNSTALFEKRPYLGCRQPGSYKNNKGVQVLNDFGLRLFYINKQQVGGVQVPVSFNHNQDGAGNKIVPYSLAWQGEDGMAENFHKQWQDMRQNSEVVKTTVMANKKVLTDLAAHNTVEINSILFLPYKIERTIPLRSELHVELIPV